MKSILVLLTICLASVGHAATKQEVVQLLNSSKDALLYTEAGATQLDEVKSHLEAVIQILESGQGTENPNACLNYAVEKYRQAYLPPDQATDKAIAVCKLISDLEIVKFVVDKYLKAYLPTADALNRAAQTVNLEVKGKVKIIQFAFDKYREAYLPQADAIDKALAIAKTISTNSFECVQTAYANYRQAYLPQADALNKAAQACK